MPHEPVKLAISASPIATPSEEAQSRLLNRRAFSPTAGCLGTAQFSPPLFITTSSGSMNNKSLKEVFVRCRLNRSQDRFHLVRGGT